MNLGRTLTLLAALACGCLRPSEERARADLRVGYASAHGLTVAITDGAAAVRTLAPGRLSLWAQAPTLDIRLSFASDAPEAWTLDVDNALPGAALVAAGAADAVLETTPSSTRPTSRRWNLSRNGASELRLQLQPPRVDAGATWRFAVVNDSHALRANLTAIFDAIRRDTTIRFVVSAGDVSSAGTTEEFQRVQELSATSSRVPFYTTIGNHDVLGEPAVYTHTWGRASFRFVVDEVQLTFLDSSAATIDALVYDELSRWLREGVGRVHVVITHVPPLDPQGERNLGFASRDEAAALLSSLARHGVDLALHGHIHTYVGFTTMGVVSYISGGASDSRESFVGVERHYVAVDLNTNGIQRVSRVDVP